MFFPGRLRYIIVFCSYNEISEAGQYIKKGGLFISVWEIDYLNSMAPIIWQGAGVAAQHQGIPIHMDARSTYMES